MKNKKRKRLFSEKQVGTLIKRATEIREKAMETPDHGLSLEEVEHIAREIGIEPKYLRTALTELENNIDRDKSHGFWGNPFSLYQTRVVEGTMGEEQWEQIIQKLRDVTGSVGTVNEIGQLKEWSRSSLDDPDMEHTQISIGSRNNQTTIRFRKQFKGGAFTAYFSGMILSGVATFILLALAGSGLSELGGFAIMSGGAFGGIFAVRTALVSWTKRQQQKMHNLMDSLQDSITQHDVSTVEQQIDISLSAEEERGREESSSRKRARS